MVVHWYASIRSRYAELYNIKVNIDYFLTIMNMLFLPGWWYLGAGWRHSPRLFLEKKSHFYSGCAALLVIEYVNPGQKYTLKITPSWYRRGKDFLFDIYSAFAGCLILAFQFLKFGSIVFMADSTRAELTNFLGIIFSGGKTPMQYGCFCCCH